MADRLLVLVPHEQTHAPRSILEQARKLGPPCVGCNDLASTANAPETMLLPLEITSVESGVCKAPLSIISCQKVRFKAADLTAFC